MTEYIQYYNIERVQRKLHLMTLEEFHKSYQMVA